VWWDWSRRCSFHEVRLKVRAHRLDHRMLLTFWSEETGE
jgi:hypothetical protein